MLLGKRKIAAAFAVVSLVVLATVALRFRTTRSSSNVKELLASKVQAEWLAFKNKDTLAYGAFLATDYVAVEVDAEGTRTRDQAIHEVERSGLVDVLLSRVDVQSLGDESAMVTYEASLTFMPSTHMRFLRVYVIEIWVKQRGEWKALHYQETRVR
jgi:hypothetical protein